MRTADAVCAQYGRPAGVTFFTQVCRYSIEPTFANRACNLLPKDIFRAAFLDEIEEHGPEVPLVFVSELLSCCGEGLAGATSSPNRAVCGPSSELQGKRPSSDSGEEVALSIGSKVIWTNINDASGIDISCWDEFLSDKLSEPSCCFWVKFIVVVHGWCLSGLLRLASCISLMIWREIISASVSGKGPE
jgi:hypothetical protein